MLIFHKITLQKRGKQILCLYKNSTWLFFNTTKQVVDMGFRVVVHKPICTAKEWKRNGYKDNAVKKVTPLQKLPQITFALHSKHCATFCIAG